MSLSPPRVVPALLGPLRADLEAAGFTVEGLAGHLGPVVTAALGRDQSLPAERVTRADGHPGAALLRLFTLAVEVPFDLVDAALPTLGGDGLVDLGLAERTGAGLRARCDLRPYSDETHRWWVASDLDEAAVGRPLQPDHVLGAGGASVTLASWTPRPRVGRALDLGTGSGVQALHLSAHADHVVVSDLSPRALAFARFNAALAELDWDVRHGSMFEPVAGELFDLVVSNPPYVITPRSARVPVFEYRDGRVHGDGVVEELVRSVGAHLAPGGIAHFLGNWEIPRGCDWRDRWRSWLAETGLDAWVVQRHVQDPAEYAETWARDGGHQRGSWVHDELYGAWLDDFAARDVAGIGFGIATLQRPRRPRSPFVDLTDSSGPVARPMGPTVLAGLPPRTWLAEHEQGRLLDTAWRAAPDVTIERHALPGASDPSAILVRQGGGLRRVVRVDTVGAGLVDVLDGQLTAGQALTAIAAILGEDAATVRAEGVSLLGPLVADGFLRRP